MTPSDPTQSFPSGSQVAPSLQPPEPPPRSGPTPMLVGGIVAVVAAIVILGIVLFTGGDDDDPVEAAQPTPSAATDPTPAEPEPEPDPTTPAEEPAATEAPEPTPEPSGPPTVQELAQAVVQVQLLLGDQVVCTGSGTILDADGTVLTNSHVIAQNRFCPHDTIGVAILDVPELPPLLLFEADLLADDPALDLAVIRIARTLDGAPVTPDFPVVQIGDSDTVELGDQLRVIGYPAVGGETITFTEGTVSGFVSTPGVGDRSWLKTDATISGGNSGGLAVDDNGTIVGIPTIVGTGNGQITDCRVIEDTNGDGRIDQDDTCVPVGGFINGIRPVNLALPLLAQARSATPIDQGPPPLDDAPAPAAVDTVAFGPRWATQLVDGVAANEVVFVRRNETVLCLTWSYRGFQPGASFETIWLIDGNEVPEAGFVGTNQGADEGDFFACFTNDAGIGPGVFELIWLVEDEPIFAHSIYVGGGRDEIDVQIVNQSGSDLCVVQFAPSGTLTFGLNRLNDVVLDGGSITVPLSTGQYDARIIDCDGIVRVEDTTGALLDQSLVLTIS